MLVCDSKAIRHKSGSHKCILFAWSKLLEMQQAFNVRIQDSGTEDGNLDDNLLPKETFGLPIPQELTENEIACMKNAVNSFMAPRFTVSDAVCRKSITFFCAERVNKLARKLEHNMGFPSRWKLLCDGRAVDCGISGVP